MISIRTFSKVAAAIVIGICMSSGTRMAFAQCQASGQDGRALLVAALRYSGIEQPPAGELLDKLAASWCKAQEPALSLENRQQALAEMFAALSEIRGRPVTNLHMFDGLASYAAGTIQNGARMNLSLPEPRGPIGDAKLDIQKFGNGPIPVVMIGDLGVDGRAMYRTFAERNSDKYSVYVVTLPGAGSSPELPWPEKLDYSAMPWLNAIQRALVSYLDTWKKPVVLVGSSGGGYFAARLAVERPQAVRAVVLVNALVNNPLRSRAKTDAPAALTERLTLIRNRASMPQLFPAGEVPSRAEIERLLGDPSSKNPAVQNWMAFAVRNETVSKRMTTDALASGFFLPGIRYGAELTATDLTESFGALKVPTLVMGSFYDDASPRLASTSRSPTSAASINS